jgi:hypothetical protein
MMIRLSRHWDHQRESKIQKSRSQRRKHGRRVPLRSSTAMMAQRDRFQQQRGAGSGFVGSNRTAPFVGIAIKAGYRSIFETTNRFARIKF